jgi:hypothetical protein
MRESALRSLLAVFLLASHVAIPALFVALYVMDGLTRDELTQLLEMVVPMVTALATFGIGYAITTKNAAATAATGGQLSRLFVAVVFAFTTLFVCTIVGLVMLKAWNIGLRSFSDLKLALAATETVFGAFTARLLATLFKD